MSRPSDDDIRYVMDQCREDVTATRRREGTWTDDWLETVADTLAWVLGDDDCPTTHLIDRDKEHRLVLDPETFDHLAADLEKPPKINPELQKAMKKAKEIPGNHITQAINRLQS